MKAQHKRRQEIKLKNKGNLLLNYTEIKQDIWSSALNSDIYVGGDSSVMKIDGEELVLFIVIVGIHKGGNSGVKVYKQATWVNPKSKETEPWLRGICKSMRLRLMAEVYMITTVATELINSVGKRPFHIHLDINSDVNCKSNVVVKEAVGYVKGMLNITPQIKPEAFFASIGADKFTKITGWK